MQQSDINKDTSEISTFSLAEQEAYWLKTLYVDLPVSDALLDHPRSTTQLFLRETVTLHETALLEDLRKIAVRENSDLLAIFIAALCIVLMGHSDQTQFAMGTIGSDCQRIRNGKRERFLNPLTLLIDASDNPAVNDFLRRVMTKIAEAGKNRDFPFDELVTALQPSPKTTRSPLFQVLVACLDLQTQLGGQPLSQKDIELVKEYTTQCDIVLLASVKDDEIIIQCNYDSTLFEPTTIHSLLEHLRVVLQRIGDDCPLSEIKLMDDAEQGRLLSDEFYPKTEFPFHSFVTYIETWASQQPDEPALIEDKKVLSYNELYHSIENMAFRCLQAGIKRGDIVAVYVERGINSAIAMLGVLKAGCVFLPLDKAWPLQRLSYILEDTQAPVLITQQSLLDTLPPYHGQVLLIEQVVKSAKVTFPTPQETEPVCILYTSGSTGRPKGVVLTQRMITNLIYWHAANYTGKKRVLQFSSIAFDQMLHEMGAAWASGGSLIAVSQAIKEDIPALADFLIAYNIERAFLPVVVTQQLAEVYLQQRRMPDQLCEVITTGEQLIITQSLRDFFSLAKEKKLINHYGPTETHVVTSHHLPEYSASWPTVPSIGRAITNVQTLVLTNNLELTPLGVWGELYLAGDCLAQGYWQSPDLTAERFRPHPFATQPGQRMYKTGDRVRYGGDGFLEFGGRFDNQVKIRGYRVEPNEIEAILVEHPEVQTALVLTKQHDQETRLIAYVVPENSTLKTAELRRYLGLHLPAYMIPTTFVLLDNLPLNANGKVNRQLLPHPEVVGESTQSTPTRPSSKIEQKLLGIWQEILHVPHIGVQDNFFALGGHSLLGAQLISRLRQEYHVELTQFDVFAKPTVAALATLIEGILLLANPHKKSEELEEEVEF